VPEGGIHSTAEAAEDFASYAEVRVSHDEDHDQ